jgi:hypothetical protein
MVHLPKVDRAVTELARVVRSGGRVIISDVHPFLVLLGWQAQFRTPDGAKGFMRLHPEAGRGRLCGREIRCCHDRADPGCRPASKGA